VRGQALIVDDPLSTDQPGAPRILVIEDNSSDRVWIAKTIAGRVTRSRRRCRASLLQTRR